MENSIRVHAVHGRQSVYGGAFIVPIHRHIPLLLCADHNDPPHLPTTLFCRETFSVSVHTLRSSTIINIFYVLNESIHKRWRLSEFYCFVLARAQATRTFRCTRTKRFCFFIFFFFASFMDGMPDDVRQTVWECVVFSRFFFYSLNQGRSLCHCYGFWLVALLYIGMHSAMHSDTIIIYIVVIVVT